MMNVRHHLVIALAVLACTTILAAAQELTEQDRRWGLELVDLDKSCQMPDPNGGPQHLEDSYQRCKRASLRYSEIERATSSSLLKRSVRVSRGFLALRFGISAQLAGLEKAKAGFGREVVTEYFANACEQLDAARGIQDDRTKRAAIDNVLAATNSHLLRHYQVSCDGAIAEHLAALERGIAAKRKEREDADAATKKRIEALDKKIEEHKAAIAESKCSVEVAEGLKSGDTRFAVEKGRAILKGKRPSEFGWCSFLDALKKP